MVAAHVLKLHESEVVQCFSDTLGHQHRLVTAVSLRRLDTQRLSRFRFRHNLFQQYLYHRLDTVRRAHLHEAVGNTLEIFYGQTSDELGALAPQLAWHFEQAGLADRAAVCHLQAGKRAALLAAHEDAISHLTRGLALIETLADTPERVGLRFELQLAIVSPISYARGFWSPERNQALERVRQISQHPALVASSRSWTASAALAYFAMWSAEPVQSLTMGGQLLHQAERNQDARQLQWAHCMVGCAHLLLGRLTLAREHLDLALEHPRLGYDHLQDLLLGIDVGNMALNWKSFLLWQLGYPDQSYRYLREALSTAQESGYSISLAHSRNMASMILSLCARNATAAGQQIQALRESSEIILPYRALADSLAGSEAMGRIQDEQALQQMRQGLARYQTTGSGLGRAGQLLLLARGYAHSGQVTAALATVDEALAWMNTTGICSFESEARRLRGELLLKDQPLREDALDAAETCFRQAIAVARRQEARWWELRATVSLCRLLKEQDARPRESRAAAREMLAEIYGWFGEGFDTVDLQEARDLLEELGS